MTRQEIENVLPHREPFLLIDEIIELDEGKRAVAIKKVNGNEYFFQGHFPGFPIMPGVLIVEAMAQTGAVAVLKIPDFQGKIGFLTGINNARFRRQVIPGDTLTLTVELEKFRFGVGVGKAFAMVNGELCAEAEIKFAIGDKPDV